MNDGTRKFLFIFATISLFTLLGAGDGFAQCSGNLVSTANQMRTQGKAEILGTITIDCTVTPATSSVTNISVILSAGTPAAGAGSTTVGTWTSSCSGLPPDSRSTFACPSISSSIAPVAQPRVAVGSNAVTFSFTPAAGLQTFTITGIRVNLAASGLAPGSALTVSVAASGGLSGETTDLLGGVVSSVLDAGSGFTGTPLSITTCAPVIPAASGAVLPANPDLNANGTDSLKVSLVEGFFGAFASAATSDGGLPGTQGVRFLIQLNGIPNGISVYAPQTVSFASAPSTGSVAGGSSLTVLAIVAGAGPDGSGGSPNPSGGNLFDMVPVSSGGTAYVVYEVTTPASLSGLETVNLFIALTGAPASVGIISGSVGLAPVGPTLLAAIPQFSAAVGSTFVANAGPCGSQQTFSAQPNFLTDVANLSFSSPSGISAAPEQFNVLTTGPTPLSWTAAVTPVSGGNWLTISPTSGTGDGSVTATVNSSSLSLGNYSANIVLTSSGANNSPYTLPVVLTVAATLLSATPASLNFITSASGPNPASEQLAISTNVGALSWSASFTTASGGNWLSVTPASGSTPGTATVSANAAGLLPGTYQGTITVSASGAGNGPQTVNVMLTVGAGAPVILTNGIVNGASFAPNVPVAPGSIVSLFGNSLASTVQAATSLPLPTTLAGTQVLVNQVPAPLFYVSPSQINFQMPFTAGGSAQVYVVANQLQSAAVGVTVSPQAPGIFTRNAGGSGQGDILNQDFSINSAQNPAAPGSVIEIYATGLGVTNPLAVAGQPGGTTPLNETVVNPTVTIGGIPANVLFSGLASGFAGAYQVNAQIPSGIAAGSAVPLTINSGGSNSNTVTVAIQ